jgi:sugar lactone lactonase YvrE
VTPDGNVRQVADDIAFPNGMVVTPDNATLIVSESFAGRLTAFDIAGDGTLSGRRVWADGVGPDSICLDADGALWTHSSDTRTHTGDDDAPEAGFACTLGGPDGRTLFMLAAEWRGIDNVDDALAKRTGQVLVGEAPAPHAGWP